MSSLAVGYLLLAVVLVLTIVGARELVAGAALRANLRARTLPEPEVPRIQRLYVGLDDAFRRTRLGDKIGRELVTAGVGWRAIDFAAMCVAAFVIGYELTRLLAPAWIGLLVGAACVRGVWQWLSWKRGRRRLAFTAQLPDLSRTLANGTQAGLSVTGALEIAETELDDPARTEIRLALAEVRIGQSFERAMEHMGERMPSRELGVLVSTLVIQQRAGGDLVRALGDMTTTLESRKDLLREVRTQMAGQVAVAYITAAIGILTLITVNLIQPGIIHKMTSSALGLVVLGLALALYTAAFILIRRIVKVDM
jgi:tight adherence protein B